MCLALINHALMWVSWPANADCEAGLKLTLAFAVQSISSSIRTLQYYTDGVREDSSNNALPLFRLMTFSLLAKSRSLKLTALV